MSQYKLASTDEILGEIGIVVANATEEGRDELSTEEIEFITRITQRMVKETKMQLCEVALLLPEEIPEETVIQILKGGAN